MFKGTIGSIGDECEDKVKNLQKTYAKMTGLSVSDMENGRYTKQTVCYTG